MLLKNLCLSLIFLIYVLLHMIKKYTVVVFSNLILQLLVFLFLALFKGELHGPIEGHYVKRTCCRDVVMMTAMGH